MSNYGSHAPPSYNFSRTLKGGKGFVFFSPSLLIFFMFLHKGNNLSYDRLLSPKLPLTYVQYMDLVLAWLGMAWLVPPTPALHYPISALSDFPPFISSETGRAFFPKRSSSTWPLQHFFSSFFPTQSLQVALDILRVRHRSKKLM